MKLRAFAKAEGGATAVIVALSLTILLGFTALTMDFGLLASTRQSMQNAVDAAALAAAMDVGEHRSYEEIYATAKEYCILNGFDPAQSNVDITVSTYGKCVSVQLDCERNMGFSAVLTGKNRRTVAASATAEAVSIFGSCPFAMFASQRIQEGGYGMIVNGEDIYINGNIHSNSDILMRNAVLGEGVVATAVRSVLPNTEGWKGNQIALDMPSLAAFEKTIEGRTDIAEFNGTIVKDSHSGFGELVDEAITKYRRKMGADQGYLTNGLYIHVKGDLIFNGNTNVPYRATFPIVLIVDGSINMNGMPLDCTIDTPMVIMSKRGMITVNGGGACFTGILYAPKGLVQINGNDAEFVGSIIAQNILKNGGKITVRYMEDTDRFLPLSKVHLIE